MKYFIYLLTIFALPAILFSSPDNKNYSKGKCVTCHKEKDPGIYSQWRQSSHGKSNVSCLDCHKANDTDLDAFEHEGALIATLVTPKDCSNCHQKEAEEVGKSYHATAGEILDSKDAYLAHVAGGHPAVIMGCENCHGSKVEIDPNSPNKLSSKSWPNSGIGRLNPDGSKGACSACHTRHSFSKAQARQPEACSKCHLGPDHPQKEIYEESKHGNAYYTNIDKMNLDSDSWVVGKDYSVAPTCATCHISATTQSPVTHDVGARLTWTLRPPVSKRMDNWKEKKDNMGEVCQSCHQDVFVENFYTQYDALIHLYNDKFAIPATNLMKLIKKKGLMKNKAAFSNKIEWVYWELWHHEGRRARHGAAMGGPDYTWWHGIYDVAKNFYFEFLPEVQHLDDPELNAMVEDMLTNNPMHNWMNQPTKVLKEGIRNGTIQKTYDYMFESEK
jgi:hydroxylamine dehydrogenase